MNILAIDDNQESLNQLTTVLQQVFPTEGIRSESDPFAAVAWLEQLWEQGNALDYVFMESWMNAMSGIELAGRIRSRFPRAVLIFCTVYTDGALAAFGLHAKGYLLKPVTAQQIIQTLDEMVTGWRQMKAVSKEVTVQTFGHFEVFVDNKPLGFEREKSKELLAYLVDRHGASVTTEQIAAVLWENRTYDRTMKNYVSTVLGSLRTSLRDAGVDDILIKTRNHLAVDVSKIKCDAYDYEQRKHAAVNAFRGEYMANYSWAEFTTGTYVTMAHERKKRPVRSAGKTRQDKL